MSEKFKTLLSPIRVGKHILKSRLVYPNASPHTLMGPETFPADGFRAFHVELARNGAAIVTIAEWDDPTQHQGPYQFDFTHMQSFDLKDPSTHNYFSLLAEEIHFYGSKLIVNAAVEWPEGYTLYGGLTRKPSGQGPTETLPIPAERIPEVINNFVDKMRLYKTMGYDGMSMRCDASLLEKGHREDVYSGETIEGRSRFVRELYAAMKKAFGDSFICECTIAWEQPWGYGTKQGKIGVSADEVAEFCHLIDGDADIFQVREHDISRSHPIGYNFLSGEHPAADFCARLKKEGIKALLEPIGGFQEPAEMEQYLLEGKCDLFGAARAFIADPDYGQKMFEDRDEDIIPCMRCNKCHGVIHDEPAPWIVMCSVNPRHGLRHEMDLLIRQTTPKKVAVIGGGAAGMRAAIEAAQRGHSVRLYEKSGVLGGQLLHADHFEFKWPLRNYKNWLIRQLEQNAVEVILNCAPTPAEIESAGFDAVLAATGATAAFPESIQGLHDSTGKVLYPHCWDVWDKEESLGEHVVIVGGSEVGIETAIHLLRRGHRVTMLTRQSRVAHDASRLHYITMAFMKQDGPDSAHLAAEWERYDKFTGITEVTTTKLEGNTVHYITHSGEAHSIDCDNIVICGGSKALLDEAMAYSSSAPRFFPIGDCIGAGSVQACNRQAWARASIL